MTREMPTRPTLYDANCDPLFGLEDGVLPALHEATALVVAAARLGICTDGTRVFLHSPPCPDCAETLASAGVTTVYHPHDPTYSSDLHQLLMLYLLSRGVDLVSMHEGDFQ